MSAKKPTMLFHIGDPRIEEPHKSLERCDKFFQENPDIELAVVIWEKKVYEELLPYFNGKPKGVLYLWEDDGACMGWLMEHLAKAVGAQVVMPMWYVCTEGHISPSTGKELRTKCVECDMAVATRTPLEERFKQFAELFANILKLTNFDTSSGEFLYAHVNPMRNLLTNMRWALRGDSCKDVVGSGKGKPAIICGAGPSLEDAIPHISRLQEQCLVLCVGRSYKALIKAGIRVDYTVSVEMFDWDSTIFDGLTPVDVGNATLLYASVCAPATVDKWPGHKMCLWDVETAKILGRDDWIMGGNSVSHHMFNFAAQILQAEPIILVGQDLAYTKPRTHAEGTNHDWPQEIKAIENAFQAEEWLPCTGKGNMFYPELHRVPVFLGGGGFALSGQIMVRSSPSYKNFATLFSILIAKHGKKVYNACPNGQKIHGTEYIDLSTYLVSS